MTKFRRRNSFGVKKRNQLVFTFTATTTIPSESVSLARVTPATGKTLDIDWGDGSAHTTVPSRSTEIHTHVYATAGTRQITISKAIDIVGISIRSPKFSNIKTAQLRYSDITYFWVASVDGIFNSFDMINWRPISFYIQSLKASSSGVLNTVHMSEWKIVNFSISSIPASCVFIPGGGLALADCTAIETMQIVGWWSSTTEMWDSLLWELYMLTCQKIETGGSLELTESTSRRPSGTFQGCVSCPVTANTPGLEILYELTSGGTCPVGYTHGWEKIFPEFGE